MFSDLDRRTHAGLTNGFRMMLRELKPVQSKYAQKRAAASDLEAYVRELRAATGEK
jgi:hypothetical protein